MKTLSYQKWMMLFVVLLSSCGTLSKRNGTGNSLEVSSNIAGFPKKDDGNSYDRVLIFLDKKHYSEGDSGHTEHIVRSVLFLKGNKIYHRAYPSSGTATSGAVVEYNDDHLASGEALIEIKTKASVKFN